MAHFRQIIFLSVFLIETIFVESKLSDYTTICSATDPKLQECFKKSSKEMLRKMENGIPELGIPQVEPCYIPNSQFDQPEIGMMLTVTNISLHRLTKSSVVDAVAEPEKFKYYLRFHLHRLDITGMYKIKGKIFIMPVHGSGKINVSMSEVDLKMELFGKPEYRNGVLHMKLTDVSVSLEPKKAKVTLDDLFNGNRMLASIMHTLLERTWKEMYMHTRPKIEKIARDKIFEGCSDFFSTVPYNQLFTDLDI